MIERWWVLILWGTGHFFPSLVLSLKVAQAGSKPGIILFSFISSHKQHHIRLLCPRLFPVYLFSSKKGLSQRGSTTKNGSKDGCLRANLEAQATIPTHNLKKISFSGFDPILALFGTHVDDVDVFREPVEDSADRGRVEEGHRRPQNP